ncbi:MAG: A/G-specific adenine glycosylase [Polyangiaceae bacterium]
MAKTVLPSGDPAATPSTGLRARLLTWYRENKRDLPWRRTRDPYAIWLSEIMLQQTRVDTAIPYYERFLSDYPTVHALAEAPLDDVLTKWSGLGYYRRARTLHAAAQQVATERAGVFPEGAAELREIKGIGPYTAGAVSSIAFDRPAALVDGNVARVYSRLFEVDDNLRSNAGMAKIWKIAEELVPNENPGDYNQALMELGATICTPRAPRCLLCPVNASCRARASGREQELPHLKAKAASKNWKRLAVVLTRGNEILLTRRRGDRLFGGMWEPPAVDGDAEDDVALKSFEALLGVKNVKYTQKNPVKHVLSHRKMLVTVFVAEAHILKFSESDEYDAAQWLEVSALDAIPVSTLCRKVLVAAGVTTSLRSPSARPKRGT